MTRIRIRWAGMYSYIVLTVILIIIILIWTSGPGCSMFDSDFECEQLKRRTRVLKVCMEEKEGHMMAQFASFDTIHVYEESQVYWCPVFKAGTTLWVRYMFDTTSRIS